MQFNMKQMQSELCQKLDKQENSWILPRGRHTAKGTSAVSQLLIHGKRSCEMNPGCLGCLRKATLLTSDPIQWSLVLKPEKPMTYTKNGTGTNKKPNSLMVFNLFRKYMVYPQVQTKRTNFNCKFYNWHLLTILVHWGSNTGNGALLSSHQ